MLKSTGNAVLSHLGSEQHPRSATDRFLSSPRLLGNRSSLSFLRCPGWLFLTSLEWVSAVSLTHNVSASPALVPRSPNSIQSLVELMQDCTSPYRSTQRHPSVCPRLWPSPPTPNSWIHNLTVSPLSIREPSGMQNWALHFCCYPQTLNLVSALASLHWFGILLPQGSTGITFSILGFWENVSSTEKPSLMALPKMTPTSLFRNTYLYFLSLFFFFFFCMALNYAWPLNCFFTFCLSH